MAKQPSRYRLVKVKGPIASRKQVAKYAHELITLLDQLIGEMKRDRAYLSQSMIGSLASQIKQIVIRIPAEVDPDSLNLDQCLPDVPAITPRS